MFSSNDFSSFPEKIIFFKCLICPCIDYSYNMKTEKQLLCGSHFPLISEFFPFENSFEMFFVHKLMSLSPLKCDSTNFFRLANKLNS